MFAALFVVLLSMTAFAGGISNVAAAQSPQGYPGTAATIMINNDNQLGEAAEQNDWAGDGSLANPWIIAGNATTHDLDMEGGAFGIYIANITSTYFNVQDWHIYNSSVGDALTIKNINTPFQVTNLTINDVENGVVINKTTDNSAVRDVDLNNIARDGISVGNSTSFYIEDNNVNNATRAIMTSYCTRSFVSNNQLTDGQGSIYTHQFVSGILLYRTSWTTVAGNSITEINMAIYPQWGYNNTIEHNQIYQCAEGIYLDQASSYNLIQSNNIFNMTERAIALNYDATQNTVANNNITNCSWEGIYSARSVRANIHDNVIVNTGTGILMKVSSTSAQITNNLIEGSGVGMIVSNSNLTSITNNYIANSTHEGLILQGTHGNNVQNNYLYNNAGYGIKADNCADSSFNLNLMSGNNGATSTYDVDDVQAFDNRTTDAWNTSSLGNYWADWTAPDADADSIVDAPYAVDGGSINDELPLAYPVGMVNDLQVITGYIWAKITWNAPNYSAGDQLLKYVINRTNGTSSTVFERAAGITELNDTTISPGITYDYEIVATNKYGQSGVMNITVFVAPSNLPVVNITAPVNGAMLNTTNVNVVWQGWDNGATITSYWYKMNGQSWVNASLSTSHLFNAAQGVVVGSNTVSVNVTNANGSSTSSVQFTVDLTAPTIQILKPLNGYLNTTGKVLTTWHGTDANGISQYQLMVDSGAWQPKGLGESATLALADGHHVISVKAIDPAGNSRVATVNVTVDTTRPLITNMNPTGGSYVNTTTVTFSWDIIETGSGVNRTNVSIDSGAVIGIGYNQSYTTGILSQGQHTFNLIVFDNASFNSSIVVQFFVDTIDPEVEISAPIEGGFVNTTDVQITWTATDTGVGASGIESLLIRNDSGPWMALSPSAVGQILTLDEGSHTVEVSATDEAGNTEIDSVTFTVDSTLPIVEIISPANDTWFNVNEVTVVWNGSDALSGLAHFEVKIDDGSWENVGYNLTQVLSGLSDGEHTFMVKAVDNATNENVISVTFTVDTTGPWVVITLPVIGLHTNATEVQMNWTAMDNTTSVAYMHVWNDTGAPVNMTTGDGYLFINLTEGAHTLYVKVWDAVGNSQENSVSVVVDLTAPEISITYPQANQLVSDVVINATWTVTDNLSSIAKIEVAIDDGSYVDVGLNASQPFADVLEGDHTIYVRATDSAGNSAIQQVFFTVDRTSPTVLTHLPASGAIVSADAVVKVTFSKAMNQSSVAFTGIVGTQSWNTAGTEVTLAHGALTDATTYNIVVSGKDLAGNELAGSSSSWSFTVDSTLPIVEIISPANDTWFNVNEVTVVWNGSDALSGLAYFEVKIDDGSWENVSYNLTKVLSSLSDGEHTFMVKAVDNATNENVVSVTFTVDTVAPTVLNHLPASGAIVSPDAVVKVTFSKVMNQTSVIFTGITGAKTWNTAGTEVTLTHAALTYATTYSVVVSGKDLAGNAVSGSWTFTVVTQVTGTVSDDKSNPIVSATVKLTQGATVVEGVTDANGRFALIVDGVGTYNLTISATGFQDFVQNDKAFGVGHNNTLGAIAMTPNADYTLVIVGVIVVLAIVLAALFLMRRHKV